MVVIHYFPPHIGGMEEVAAAQAASLGERGHEVTVLTCAHERGLGDERAEGRTLLRVGAVNVIERRFGVTFPLVSPSVLLRLVREVRRAGIVHVHDVFYPTSWLAFLVCSLLRRPFHLTQHVALVEHPSRLVMAVQRAVYATVGSAMFRRAAHVVVYNANVREFVVARGADGSRVTMNHNGIDTAEFSPATPDERAALRERHGFPADRPIVLFAGRLVPKKGHHLVIEAATTDWTTLVVGDGARPQATPGDHVVLHGPASRETLRDLYRLSDVFVFPAAGELFTLTMQEAMACGLPVVTTDDPAYGEYQLDRDGIALVERDVVAIRAAVGDVLGDPRRAARMREYSRRLAIERFSWDANYVREYAVYGVGGGESGGTGVAG